eukprot:Phypoly_transcript_14955.p1 GENE.Phypoly_transcript_14955~~Phypoly_transcript_14955.p1  ORF type:complete len:294 (+),score=41.39 Phypoly_transcript_14955:100-882(+)
MACRDVGRCNSAMNELRTKTDRGEMECMKLDLASQKSIREFAEEFKNKQYPLHVLINNAGVYKPPLMRTEEGHELQFGVNHLGHFLLTNLLLDTMKKTFPASTSPSSYGRIITLSSRAHFRGTINFDDLDSNKSYNPDTAYGQSKLANLLFTKELNKRLIAKNYPILTNAVHPGIVYSEMFRHYSWLVQWAIYPFASVFFSTPKQGAATPVYLATTTDTTSGEYFIDKKPAPSSAESYDTEVARKLWEVSANICGISGEV